MTPPFGSAVFLDANILIYMIFEESPFHDATIRRVRELESARVQFWASRQVLREYLSSASRPGNFRPQPSPHALATAVRHFQAKFQIADDDVGVTDALLDLIETRTIQGKQIHDANIVATMRSNGIKWLLTHNTSDFARYAPTITVLPLLL